MSRAATTRTPSTAPLTATTQVVPLRRSRCIARSAETTPFSFGGDEWSGGSEESNSMDEKDENRVRQLWLQRRPECSGSLGYFSTSACTLLRKHASTWIANEGTAQPPKGDASFPFVQIIAARWITLVIAGSALAAQERTYPFSACRIDDNKIANDRSQMHSTDISFRSHTSTCRRTWRRGRSQARSKQSLD